MSNTLSERTVIANKCVLYKQARSKKWWCRIKLGNGKWYRVTTGCYDIDEAFDKAIDIHADARANFRNNLPQTTRSFSSVAKSIIANLESLKGTSDWKVVYKDYIQVINKYQIPYFNRTRLDNIRDKYVGYIDYVAEQLGRRPAASTISNHHAALKLILDRSKERGWVVDSQLPKLKNDGKSGDRRATFDMAEYRVLIKRLRQWVKQPTHRKKDSEIRQLLYDYVLILAYSGIRHGREAFDIKWRNIELAESKSGNPVVLFNVLKKKGRKGEHSWRKAVVRNNRFSDAKKVLCRLKDRVPELQKLSLDELINSKKDIPLFCLADKSQPQRIDGTFKKFLIENDLAIGSEDKVRTLYSLRHFYATQQLTKKKPTSIALLALQMGTSIKMIEKYYGHLSTVTEADILSGWEDQL